MGVDSIIDIDAKQDDTPGHYETGHASNEFFRFKETLFPLIDLLNDLRNHFKYGDGDISNYSDFDSELAELQNFATARLRTYGNIIYNEILKDKVDG